MVRGDVVAEPAPGEDRSGYLELSGLVFDCQLRTSLSGHSFVLFEGRLKPPIPAGATDISTILGN
jgi:hypothetical protein